MLLGVPLHEILWLALALVIGGLISGVLAGLFGVSGGSVIVPVLYEAFRVLGVPEDVRMQLCLGTSIAIVVPTTIRSYLTHRSKGAVVPGVIRQWALPAVIGVACSAVIASFAPAAVLTVAFVLVASFIAFKLLFAGDRWNLGNELPGPLPMTFYGFGIGFFGWKISRKGACNEAQLAGQQLDSICKRTWVSASANLYQKERKFWRQFR
jgi:uncharacterized protein